MEMMSIPLSGDLHHPNSTGRNEIIRQHDVQIMSAGSGIAHSEMNAKKDQQVDVKNARVGPHPHRGLSPVTFIFKGGVHHRDSSGNSSINEQGELPAFYMASFHKDGEGVQITARADSVLFLGTGEPLNEPVVPHGPFVMNNKTQLLQAFRDYQMGKMGVLIED